MGIFPLVSESTQLWEALVLLLGPVFCPGVRSPFPFTRLMLFHPRDLGTEIINDPGSDLAVKEHSEALSLGVKNKDVKNYDKWEF